MAEPILFDALENRTQTLVEMRCGAEKQFSLQVVKSESVHPRTGGLALVYYAIVIDHQFLSLQSRGARHVQHHR